jgi:hypothetical protein
MDGEERSNRKFEIDFEIAPPSNFHAGRSSVSFVAKKKFVFAVFHDILFLFVYRCVEIHSGFLVRGKNSVGLLSRGTQGGLEVGV